MAHVSKFQQLFQERLDQAAEIQSSLAQCRSDMADTVFRTKVVIADSRELIIQLDKLLALR